MLQSGTGAARADATECLCALAALPPCRYSYAETVTTPFVRRALVTLRHFKGVDPAALAHEKGLDRLSAWFTVRPPANPVPKILARSVARTACLPESLCGCRHSILQTPNPAMPSGVDRLSAWCTQCRAAACKLWFQSLPCLGPGCTLRMQLSLTVL